MKKIILASNILLLFLASALLSSEETPTQDTVTRLTFEAPDEIRGKHYFVIKNDLPVTVEELNSIAKSAEVEYHKLSGFKADLVITIKRGTIREIRLDGGLQRPNSKYNIIIQHVEKYLANEQPFASTTGVPIELDHKNQVIPINPTAAQNTKSSTQADSTIGQPNNLDQFDIEHYSHHQIIALAVANQPNMVEELARIELKMGEMYMQKDNIYENRAALELAEFHLGNSFDLLNIHDGGIDVLSEEISDEKARAAQLRFAARKYLERL